MTHLIKLLLLFMLLPVVFTGTEAVPRLDTRGDSTVNEWSRYSGVRLETKKSRFHSGEDIEVRFRITNKGYRAFRFYPSQEEHQSYQFLVLDKNGRELPVKMNYESVRRREKGEHHILTLEREPVKEIILEPGESFERKIFLNDYYDLSPDQEYRLTGYFYPDARHDFAVKTENRIRLFVDRRSPDLRDLKGSSGSSDSEKPYLSPEETVHLFLSAELSRNWNQYLKYLDLESFILAYDRFAYRFSGADEKGRYVILEEFRDFLRNPPSRLLRYRITGTTYEKRSDGSPIPDGRSYVRVNAERYSDGVRTRYEYIYTLEKNIEAEGFWKILHTDARILR